MKNQLMTTKRIAVSAMLSALSFVFMFIGAVTGVFDLCAVVIGALSTAFAVIEIKGVYPWLIAAVTGVLCILLLPDKFVALEYIVLGGIYPILKAYFERMPKVTSYVVKLIYFNVLLTACLALAKFIFGMNDDFIGFGIVIYALANVYFIIYDYALTVFISFYFARLRSRLKIKL